jgi:hypothetical protein
MYKINDPIRGGLEPEVYPTEYERLAKTSDGWSKLYVSVALPEPESGGAYELASISQDDIVSMDVSYASSSGRISMGGLILPTMQLRVKETVNIPWELDGRYILWNETICDDDEAYDRSVTPYIGYGGKLYFKGSPTRDGDTLIFTAVSSLADIVDKQYVPSQSLHFPCTIGELLEDVREQLDQMRDFTDDTLEINTDRIDPSVTVTNAPQGLSYRDVIGSVAEYFGCFATIDRFDDYVIYFIWYDDVIQCGAKVNVSEDICDSVMLTDTDEYYKGITYVVGDTTVSKGSEPRLALDNKLGLLDSNFNASNILAKLSRLRCRTGSVSLSLGNALLDPWDVIVVKSARGHNLINCTNPGIKESDWAITRRQDGAYILKGSFNEPIDFDLKTNSLPDGTYKFPASIVNPSGFDIPGIDPDADPQEPKLLWSLYEFNSAEPSVYTIRPINYDEVFEVPDPENPEFSENYDRHVLTLTIFGGDFNNLILRPMILRADDSFDQWEPFRQDMTVPVCQIDHHYDGGLRTTITAPEIRLNDEPEAQSSGGGQGVKPYNEVQGETYTDSIAER